MRIFLLAVAAMFAATAAISETGGAEYVEITGSAGALVLRDGPTTGAAIVDRLNDGTLLRTVECKIAAGRKWCEVEALDNAAVKGWVGMTNLRVVPAPTPTN